MSFGLFKGMGGTPNDSVWNPARQNSQGFKLPVVDPSFSSSTSSHAQSIWRNPFAVGGNPSHPFMSQSTGQANQSFGGPQFSTSPSQYSFQNMFGGPSFDSFAGYRGTGFNANSMFGFNPASVFGFNPGTTSGFGSGGLFGGRNPAMQPSVFGGSIFQNLFSGTSGLFQQSAQLSPWRVPGGGAQVQTRLPAAQISDWLAQFRNQFSGAFFQPNRNPVQPQPQPQPYSQPQPQPYSQPQPPVPVNPPPPPVVSQHPITPESLPPSPAPEPAPSEGFVPVPIPSPPAPEPAPSEGFIPVPVPPAPEFEPAPPPPAAVSAAQLETLELMKTVARAGSSTLDQKRTLLEAYAAFRPDAQATQQLAKIASAVAAEAFSRPSLANAARDWDKPGFDRAGALQELVGVMNATLGMDVKVAFFDTPPVNGKIQHGFYSPSTNTINLNTDKAATGSFSLGAKTVFHEMIHAFHFNRTKHLGLDEVVENVKTGEISITDGMAYFNLRQGNYFSASEATQAQYETNPHEKLAFLGQKLFEDELKRYNVPDSHQTLASNHPLMQHLRDHGLA